MEIKSEQNRLKQDDLEMKVVNQDEKVNGNKVTPKVNLTEEPRKIEVDDDSAKLKKILQFEAKPVSVMKLYYSLSERSDVLLMILATLGSLGSGVSMPLFSILFGSALSSYGAEQNETPSIQVLEDAIGDMVTKFLIVGVGMFISYFLMMTFWLLAGMRQIHKLKELYFRIILKQEQGFFDSNNAFEFSTKVQAQIKQVEGGVGEKFGTAVMMFSQLVTGLIIALTTSWKLTLVIISVSPLIVMSVLIMAKAMQSGLVNSRKAYEQAGGIAEEVLYNVKTVASFSNFDFEIQRFTEKIDNCKEQGIKNGFKLGVGIGCLYFFLFSSYCIAVIYGSKLIISEEINSNSGKKFMGGDVLTVILSTIMAVFSLGSMAPNIKAIGEACVAASDFFQLMDRVPQIDTSTSTQKPLKETLSGRIEMRNIEFAYPSKPDLKILKNIDITFEPGKKVALVGESGSGKSTIVNLLERLYDLTEGSITIDGINIKDFDVNYLRSLIGYVQQEPVLFNRSIRDNIIFGRDLTGIGNVDHLIQEACEDAHANEFINKIPEKYNYMVGIKGSKLSGGQKQRIAIARAILMKPKILLLDEATSALDNKSEKEVQKALDTVSAKNVTTIIIAHRLSTVKNADTIYAIKNGKVVEIGTHKELLAKNGYYAGLVKSQMADEIINTDKLDIEDDVVEKVNIICTEVNDELGKLKQSATHLSHEGKLVIEDKIQIEEVKQINRIKLLGLLSDNKGNIFWASFGAALNGCVFPIYGFMLSTSINTLSSIDKNILDKDGLFMGMMFLVVAAGAGIGNFLQNYKFIVIGEVLTAKLRNLIFEKYLRLHVGYFDKNSNSPGALLTKLSLDTALLNGIVLTVVGISVQTSVCLGLALGLGLSYDWRIGLISLCFFPFIIVSAYFQQKVRQGFSQGDDKLDIEAGSILSECVINTKTIFSFNFKDKAVEMYLDILSYSKSNFLKQCVIVGLLMGVGQFAIFSAYATLFFAGGRFIVEGTLTFDNMTRAIMIILFAAFGIGIAQQYAGDHAKAANAFASLYSTLETNSTIDTTVEANIGKKSAKDIKGRIEFKDVVFAYPTRPNAPVIKRLSFTIEPGQSAAFVGFSGSGKSTIIQLIERYYDIQEGQILIDGVDIKEYNLLELRRKIGLVSQEPNLFKRSVKENIRYGNLNANDEQIRQAAKDANILKFFTEGNDGTKDTPVSGGEKQRIAIARAFLKNPKILLLDEATSALDKDSEDEVQKALDALSGGRTSISIAHRLSTVENCDVIYVLESGNIVEFGTHKELYAKKEKYYTLHKYSSQP